MALSIQEYERRLVGEIATDVNPAVARLDGSDDLNALVDDVVGKVEAMIDRSIPRPPETKLLACRAGCAFCCHQFEVHASALEVLRIADHVQKTFDEPRRAALQTRLDDIDAKRADVPLAQWAFHPQPCPLLEDGRCGIYPVRPLVCRSVTSFDVDACKTRGERPGGAVVIPVHAMIQVVARAAKTIFLRASEEAPGGGGMLDLARGLKVALALPDAARRWIRGERIFDRATARVGPQAGKK